MILKKHELTVLSKDIWEEIDFIFWRSEVSCLPKGSSGDGFLAENIKTTKHGVQIDGIMTFLGGSRRCFELPMVLCLSRPRFSSIESVTQKKVRTAEIIEAEIEEKTLFVIVD